MKLKKVEEWVGIIRKHPIWFIASLTTFWLANTIYCISWISYRQNHDSLTHLQKTFFIWPILLIVYGSDMLLCYWRSAGLGEKVIHIRRARVLSNIWIWTLFILVVLIAFWLSLYRHIFLDIEFYYSSEPILLSLVVIILVIVVAIILVVATWQWSKYANHRISRLIKTASNEYLLSIISLVITVITYFAYNTYSKIEMGDLEIAVSVLQGASLTFAFFTLGMWFLGYLRPSNVLDVITEQINYEKVSKPEHVSTPKIAEYIEKADAINITFNDIDKIDSIIALLQEKSVKIPEHHPTTKVLSADQIITERITLIRGRLTSEINELTKRGNLNLTIGILTTVAAASALFWGLIATQPSNNVEGVSPLLMHYIPRISFAIFIEIFAFFFLKLYKNSLEDIKYYHNELTNLDSRLLALEVASRESSSKSLGIILVGLLNTERNFILKKGESTVELEKIKTEQLYLRSIIEGVSTKIPDVGKAKLIPSKGGASNNGAA